MIDRKHPKLKGLFVYAARGSDSARTLSDSLACRRWREHQLLPQVRRSAPVRPFVVNWGSSVHPEWLTQEKWPWPNKMSFDMLNKPENVATAVNKLSCFKALQEANDDSEDADIRYLSYYTTPETAAAAMRGEDENRKMLARYKLNGTNGDGIELFETPEALLAAKPAKLYTAYFPKTHEFRVHVFRGEVIDFTQKRLREGANRGEINLIRNLAGGWVHSHTLDLQPEDKTTIMEAAKCAIQALGLDFGAVDVLARLGTKEPRKVRSFAICEVNTAPGLGNEVTISAYKDAIAKAKIDLRGRL